MSVHKNYCVFGYFGFNNFGDDLMLKNSLDFFDNQEESIKITVFVKENHYSELKSFNSFKNLNVRFVKLTKWVNYFKIYTIINTCTSGFWLGGTCLYETSQEGLSGLEWLKRIILIFKKKNKPFSFCNIGVGKFHSAKGLSVFKDIINNTTAISCRDTTSSDNINSAFPNYKNLELGGDLASILKHKEKGNNQKHILFSGHYQYKDDDDLVNFYSKELDKLSSTLDMPVIFLPMHQGELNDNLFHEKIASKMKMYNKIATYNFDSIDDLIKESFFWVSMRLHGVLMSDIFGVPNMGIAYHEKVKTYIRKTEVVSDMRIIEVKQELNLDVINKIIKKYYKPEYFLNNEARLALNGMKILF